MLGVGNVGETLAPYTDSDTYLTRDAGFTWEEIHKDAHMWEFGDSGAVIVIVNDEEPTDHVQYSIDEGKTWREYNFGIRLRITSLYTVPADNSRKFLLVGYEPRDTDKSVAVHLDFSSLTHRQCEWLFDSLFSSRLCACSAFTDVTFIHTQVNSRRMIRQTTTLSCGVPARSAKSSVSLDVR